ncbi:MAG: AsnC family transcriptional regulator [Nitrosopumilaceae archaeon]|nr:AsnC family transcriptional regulator [Nitrosopumilaceae archaeon]NIU00035.1 AsnC family transcriptional regulator [Nitrosopumilaceae archaeon]NIU86413.1 AsnC family transcriptional regulator [Nitrosopumilaceae archaeon]NIV65123.1 AsnC family transcriptional regulator [Nitrosopumilaceae archaeon]NIX60637.1 AsnC family transcriptional regulator [Nitrosopumilaceae archaeon]
MPHNLDEVDIAILNSLMEDGRKSFRQIGREIKVTTPTVQARYRRLVNLGFIKSISPVLDLSKLDKKSKKQIKKSEQKTSQKLKLDTNHDIKVVCDYCDGPVMGKPSVLKFAQFERFFCCNSCKTLYKEKYGGRIRSISNTIEEN